MSDEFGEQRVFMDIDDIPPGVNFRDYIGAQVQDSGACLAVIGPRWVETLNERAEDPRDFVRIELELAHELGIPVIPLTLDDTPVPQKESLPRALHPLQLPEINSQPIHSGADLKNDLDRLVRGLRRLLDEPESRPTPPKQRKSFLMVAVAVVAALAVLAFLKINPEQLESIWNSGQPSSANNEQIAPATDRTLQVDLKKAVLAPGTRFRDELKSGGKGPEMIVLPQGSFLMGSLDHEPDRGSDE